MLLTILTLSIGLSTLIIIVSVKNAIPVDNKLNPLKEDEKNKPKKNGLSKSMVFGNQPKPIA